MGKITYTLKTDPLYLLLVSNLRVNIFAVKFKVQVVDTKTQTGYNIQVKFPNAELLESFQKKWEKSVYRNSTTKEDFRKRSESNPNPRDRRLLRTKTPQQPAGPVATRKEILAEYIFPEWVFNIYSAGPFLQFQNFVGGFFLERFKRFVLYVRKNLLTAPWCFTERFTFRMFHIDSVRRLS